ncbi:hypothetical protein EDD36DRAFT_187561 [Exophiala viscosa]|uniref:Uncharacterized protein n=1 Tax=Exophiala viscosa TaxID=2486360 RepID=A0AAN6DZZ3_9EURO|nr:hypothetical protein EDD36DRAFT_187561 [Exophiala viscosa]
MADSAMPTSQEPPQALAHPNTAIDPQTEYLYQNISHYPFYKDREYQAGLGAILGHEGTPATEDEIRENAALVLQAQLFYFARKYNVQPIDPNAYSAWVQTQSLQQIQQDHPSHLSFIQQAAPTTLSPDLDGTSLPAAAPAQPTTLTSTSAVPPQSQTQTQTQPPSSEPEPPYPTSFAAIIDLITRNVPIPGIEEIPTTILEPGSSKIDKNPRRKKPWEKDAETSTTSPAAEAAEVQTETPAQTEAGTETEVEPAATDEDVPTTAAMINVNGHKETGQGVVNILKPNAIPDSGLLSKD